MEEKKMSSLKNKNLLITGGSGSIGTYLIEMLDDSNKILNIDIKPSDKSIENKVIFEQANIFDTLKINEIVSSFKPDILFHLAAVFQRTAETIDFRNECFSTNVIGTHNVFEACIKNSIKQIVFASSYLIYDPNQYLFNKERLQSAPVLLDENSPINPRNITGVAKLYSERELEFYEKMGIITTSLRIFRVYGPKNKDVIERWIKSLLLRESINVYGDQQVFDFVHAKDVALGCLKSAIAQKSGIFNISSGVPTKIETVLKILENEFSQNFKRTNISPKDFTLYEKCYADLIKSNKELNYKPEISIEQGISQNIKILKKNM